MKRRLTSILALVIMLLNTILLSIPAYNVNAVELGGNEPIIVESGIKKLMVHDGKIIILKNNGEVEIVEGDNKTILEGQNYQTISKELLINEDGLLFNLEKNSFEELEVANQYIELLKTLNEKYDFDNIYILDDKIALVKKLEESFEISYVGIENDEFVQIDKISDIITNDVDFDVNGQLYIDGKGNLSIYKENQFVKIDDIDEKCKLAVYDNKDIVLYSGDSYYNYTINNDNTVDSDVEVEGDTEEKVDEVLPDVSGDAEQAATYSVGETIKYQTHVQNVGWQAWRSNGEMSGTSGQALRLEGINIVVENLPEGVGVAYRTHIQDVGWQAWKYNGEMSGTSGVSKRLEGIEIKLVNAPENYHVEYRVHVQDVGWQAWRRDGAMAGTSGVAKRLEGIEIRLVKDEPMPTTDLTYNTFVQNEGWKNIVNEGQYSGSDNGNKVQALKINLNDPSGQISMEYRAHVAFEGWKNWVKSGEVAGATDGNRSLEAFEIKLVNAPSNYHIQYRANIKGYGWQGWKQDGDMAGTTGLSSEIIGIEIRLVKDIAQPTVKYQTHVQNEGWQAWKSNGSLSGTEGKGLRLEGIKINLENLPSENEILYRTHVQNEGWHGWVANGEMSGTSGKSYRLEGIQIKLKNEIPGYKLYYRVHVQDYGWQEWKTNGETAGTVGSSKRLEAIEIKLVKDNLKTIIVDPGHNSGGDYGAQATHGGVKYSEATLNMQISSKLKRALEAKGYNVVMTINPGEHDTLASKESLYKRVDIANNLNADFFISVHQNSSTSSSVKGVEAYYSSAAPRSGGVLLANGIEYNEYEKKMRSYSNSEKVAVSSKITGAIVNSIASKMGRVNRGPKDDDFYVVKNTLMPSVLLECGFISNADEAKFLNIDYQQQTMSEIIANEIAKVF